MTQWNGQYVTDNLELIYEPVQGFEKLLGIALRKNKKRAHLLVSTVLGKHIPQSPTIINNAAYTLTMQILDPQNKKTHIEKFLQSLNTTDTDIMNVHHQTMDDVTVFGYAETATCLGALVAYHLNADYLHSTRYPLPNTKDYGTFSEDHSHASEHHIRIKNFEMLDNPLQTIVLVDDELTTGNTIMNTIKLFESHTHHQKYYVVTLTDMRTEKDHQKFAQFEKDMKISIEVVSLLSTQLHIPDNALQKSEQLIENIKNNTVSHVSCHKTAKITYHNISHIPSTSCGIDNKSLKELDNFAKQFTKDFTVSLGEKILVLGDEEFMYFPLLIAQNLEKNNSCVKFSATTQSPVVSYDNDGYAIRDRISYKKTNHITKRFIYNVGESFDRIIFVTDKNSHNLQNFFEQLGRRTDYINVIEVKGE